MGFRQKNFRKRAVEETEYTPESTPDEDEIRSALEEVRFLQKQRGRPAGVEVNAVALPSGDKATVKAQEKVEAEGEKEELVLQDTFAQETAVTVEDPNMIKYVELELAKKRGRDAGMPVEEVKPAEDELYIIPEHLKVRRRNSEESSTQWTTGIAEVQLPIEYKLKNIEETEAAKKQLQDKRPFVGRGRWANPCIVDAHDQNLVSTHIIQRVPLNCSANHGRDNGNCVETINGGLESEPNSLGPRVPTLNADELHQLLTKWLLVQSTIPASYSADYFQRGREYAEKLRREHPELYKDREGHGNGRGSGDSHSEGVRDVGNRRQAATDEIMLERFRKRERSRLMRR